jgi:hypothetical protein
MFTAMLSGEPAPGDLFREYAWYCTGCDAGNAWRIGTTRFAKNAWNGQSTRSIPFDIDLEHAIRAEIQVEYIECHATTHGYQISVNDKGWIPVPAPDSVPATWTSHQVHYYPTFSVPLDHFASGQGNVYRMKIEGGGGGAGSQVLINGAIVRIYYDATKKTHATATITSPQSGDVLGLSVLMAVRTSGGNIDKVDYLVNCEDVNWEGDGVYRQWHYVFLHNQIRKHAGTATQGPDYAATWDTEWTPSQTVPFSMAARVIDATGLVLMTDAISDLTFSRKANTVELCRPYNVPTEWVTRRGTKSAKFKVSGDLSKANSAKMVWNSWAGSYCAGVQINGSSAGCGPGGNNYATGYHEQTISDLSMFKTGENTVSTTGTSGNKHGMEVNYPGMQILIKYTIDEPGAASVGSRGNHNAPRVLPGIQRVSQGIMVRNNSVARSTIVLTNLKGRKVHCHAVAPSRSHLVKLSTVARGVYMLRVSTGNEVRRERIVVR